MDSIVVVKVVMPEESLPQGAVKSIFIFDGSFFSLIHYGREEIYFTSQRAIGTYL